MMNETALDRHLRNYSPAEKNHLSGIKKDYSALPQVKAGCSDICYRFGVTKEDLKQALLEKKILSDYYNFAVIKQDRFENVPMHVHEWVELCYVYSGTCTIIINENTLILNAGEMLLISPDTPHRIGKCLENDIVINFLITREYLNGTFFGRLTKDNIITQFFIEALNNKSQIDSYIFFRLKSQNRLAQFSNQFLCEFYSPSVTSGAILDAQMTQLICELINVFQHNMEQSSTASNQIYSILRYLEMNYAACTLESTAAFFNMHPNYLSTYIKKHTGNTYKQLIQTQKLTQAAMLLRTTNLPTCDISIAVGYENTSFFFKKFETKFGCTPKEYRCQQLLTQTASNRIN